MGTSDISWDAERICPYVISMPHNAEARASVLDQLRMADITNARVWPGIVLQSPDELEVQVRTAADACLVPPSYSLDSANDFLKWRGTIGSTLAHLQLLRHVWHNSTVARSPCKWALVLADDVAHVVDERQRPRVLRRDLVLLRREASSMREDEKRRTRSSTAAIFNVVLYMAAPSKPVFPLITLSYTSVGARAESAPLPRVPSMVHLCSAAEPA